MSIDSNKIKEIADKLLAIAAIVAPQSSGAVLGIQVLADLFSAGTDLNGLLKQIKEQTEENAPEVLAAVIADYNAASKAWDDSVAASQKAP